MTPRRTLTEPAPHSSLAGRSSRPLPAEVVPDRTPRNRGRRGDDRSRRGRRPAAPETGLDPQVKEYTPDLAVRGITGHLVRTTTGTMAWYRLAPRPWSMRSDEEREGLINAVGLALTQLTNRWLHWRVTWRPFPAADWARLHDTWAYPLPDEPGGVTWEDHLLAEQARALESQKAIKEVFLGVEIRNGRSRLGKLGDRLAASSSYRVANLAGRWVDAELSALDDEIRRVDSLMATSALAAEPVNAAQMLHLLYRSCALGLPAETIMPAAPHTEWDTEDMAAVEGLAQWSAEPYAPTVQVRGVAGGRRHDRHVLIGSLGRMGEIDVPVTDLPWMTVTDELAVPIEWSGRMRVLPQEVASRSLRHVAARVDAQQHHYEGEHNLDAPPVLSRQIDLASEVRDELDTDHTGLSARCEGWWRMAIPGHTEAEALETFEQLRYLYHPKIAVERSEAQHALAREFIPGEPLANTAYRRRMSVRHAAMAVPVATDLIGDQYGPLTFTSRTSDRVIPWNPWHDMDNHQVSGLTPIIGGLGSGKTFLMGTLAVQAVRSLSAYVTLLDPSGPLTELTKMPELAPYSRSLELLDAPAGTLNP